MTSSKSVLDGRGSLSKLEDFPITFSVAQAIVSKTIAAGTRRGLHHAKGSSSEKKIILCIKGKMLWISLEKREKGFKLYTHLLSSELHNPVTMERGLVHGCIALEDNTELLIVSDRPYNHADSVYYDFSTVEEYITKTNSEYAKFFEHFPQTDYHNQQSDQLKLPYPITTHHYQ